MMASHFFDREHVSDSDVREYKVLEQEMLHDEAYRWEVISQLMQANGDAIAQFCRSWLSEGLPRRSHKRSLWRRGKIYPNIGRKLPCELGCSALRVIISR